MLRNSAWDALHLGYFLGYACWNYFTTPFLFSYPGVQAREDRTLARSRPGLGGACRCASRRRSPRTIPIRCFTSTPLECNGAWTTSPKSTGSTLVGHYTSRYKTFDGLLVATRRRVFRRNPDNTVNLNLPSITLDIHDVELVRSGDEQARP